MQTRFAVIHGAPQAVEDPMNKAIDGALEHHRSKRDARTDLINLAFAFGVLDCANPSCFISSARAYQICPKRRALVDATAEAGLTGAAFEPVADAYVQGYYMNCSNRK